jgi:hypothetical protein
MATRFAIATGNWSSTAIWDNGALPASDDIIHSNGFTVTVDQDVTIGSLRNTVSSVYLPSMPIPLMTGNLLPSGVVDASGNTSTAYVVFDQVANTSWLSNTANTGWISYDFGSNKLIKRYYVKSIVVGGYGQPASWNFEGWNGSSWDVLENKTGMASATLQAGYLSPVLPHSTQYSLYRFNILSGSSVGFSVSVSQLEMTESTGSTYGTTTGGTFTVPNTLSGIRNITQTGDGIISNNAATIVSTNNTTGNTVNFNVSGAGLILNQLHQSGDGSFHVINILGNGNINFNSNIYGPQNTVYNQTGTIGINSSAMVTINGDVYLAKGNSGANTLTISLTSPSANSAILNINGSVIASNLYNTSYIYHNSAGTINITGNLISDTGSCIVAGNIGQFTGSNGFINLVGTATMTNSSSQPCIISRLALVTITGSVTNKGNGMAISAARIRWVNTGTPYWVFQDTTGADLTLTYNTSIFNYPSTSNVRLGVTYASFPTLTGTCAVPLPQYVSQGVPVDATVGTAYFNASDVWNVLISNITVAGSIGERLKTVATVETTGDQIQAYQA